MLAKIGSQLFENKKVLNGQKYEKKKGFGDLFSFAASYLKQLQINNIFCLKFSPVPLIHKWIRKRYKR